MILTFINFTFSYCKRKSYGNEEFTDVGKVPLVQMGDDAETAAVDGKRS